MKIPVVFTAWVKAFPEVSIKFIFWCSSKDEKMSHETSSMYTWYSTKVKSYHWEVSPIQSWPLTAKKRTFWAPGICQSLPLVSSRELCLSTAMSPIGYGILVMATSRICRLGQPPSTPGWLQTGIALSGVQATGLRVNLRVPRGDRSWQGAELEVFPVSKCC